jgi:hypothetical protein
MSFRNPGRVETGITGSACSLLGCLWLTGAYRLYPRPARLSIRDGQARQIRLAPASTVGIREQAHTGLTADQKDGARLLPQPRIGVRLDEQNTMKDKYIILTENAAPMLAQAVQEKINDGYQPIGGVAVTANGKVGQNIFAQAMVLTSAKTGR